MSLRFRGLYWGLAAALLAGAAATCAEPQGELIARIASLRFAPSVAFDHLGSPGPGQALPATPDEARLGLSGRVRFVLGDPAKARALTFFVFESFDRARRAVRDRTFLAAELMPAGVPAGNISDLHVNPVDDGSNRIGPVSCFGGPTDHDFRVRCYHLEADSPVLVLAESLAEDLAVTSFANPIFSGDGGDLAFVIFGARRALAGDVTALADPVASVMSLDLSGRRGFLENLGLPNAPIFDARADLGYGDRGFLGVVKRPFLVRIHGSMPLEAAAEAGLEAGLEFWVFADAAAADTADFDDDFYFNTLYAPGGLGDIDYINLTHHKGAETVTLTAVACATLDVPATLSHQIRCEYRLHGSNVRVVAYSYNAPAGFAEIASEVRRDVLDALFGGLSALADAGIGVLDYAAAPPSSPQPPPSLTGSVEAGLPGAWETDMPAPGGGWDRWRLEIAAAGSYTFLVNGAFVHRGRIEAAQGQWTLVSETSDWTDGGSFILPEAGSLVLFGRLGVSTWRRPAP